MEYQEHSVKTVLEKNRSHLGQLCNHPGKPTQDRPRQHREPSEPPSSAEVKSKKGILSHHHPQPWKCQAQQWVTLLAWEISQHIFITSQGCLHHPQSLPHENCNVNVYCCHSTFTWGKDNTHPLLWRFQRGLNDTTRIRNEDTSRYLLKQFKISLFQGSGMFAGDLEICTWSCITWQ